MINEPFHTHTRMNRPFHVFFFRLLTWTSYGKSVDSRKERLQISKMAKFEGDLWKTNEVEVPQSREILQTFVMWGNKFAPTLPYKPLQILANLRSYIFARLRPTVDSR